jgi:hypothetical protein
VARSVDDETRCLIDVIVVAHPEQPCHLHHLKVNLREQRIDSTKRDTSRPAKTRPVTRPPKWRPVASSRASAWIAKLLPTGINSQT